MYTNTIKTKKHDLFESLHNGASNLNDGYAYCFLCNNMNKSVKIKQYKNA